MNVQQIWAITLRHILQWLSDVNLLLMALYWPILELFLWGFLGAWIAQMQQGSHDVQLNFMIGIFLWRIATTVATVARSSLFEEIWSYNLINLFASPLTLFNWMLGVLLFAAIVSMVMFAYCTMLLLLLFPDALTTILKNFLIFLPPMFICGIWLGYMALSFVVYFGKRADEITYVIIWGLSPFALIYYPLEALPAWAQTVSSWFPMRYIFQGMRGYILHDQSPMSYLIKGYALAIIYATLSLWVLSVIFKLSKRQGLARLSD